MTCLPFLYDEVTTSKILIKITWESTHSPQSPHKLKLLCLVDLLTTITLWSNPFRVSPDLLMKFKNLYDIRVRKLKNIYQKVSKIMITNQGQHLYPFHTQPRIHDDCQAWLRQLHEIKLQQEMLWSISSRHTPSRNYPPMQDMNIVPVAIGRTKSSINFCSMVSRPKSSRTAPYLFIVLGRMILNFVSCTHFSKFST